MHEIEEIPNQISDFGVESYGSVLYTFGGYSDYNNIDEIFALDL